jgi:hypothetical protein
MQAPAFGDQPSRANQIYTTVQRSEQHERAGLSYQAVVKILVLVRRPRAGLVFDSSAAVAHQMLTTGFTASPSRSRSATPCPACRHHLNASDT